MSLRTYFVGTIALILAATLALSAALTYSNAVRKVGIELNSALGAGEQTIALALREIATSSEPSRQLELLVHTFDNNRHLRVELVDPSGRVTSASRPESTVNDVPDWFFHLIAGDETSRIIEPPRPLAAEGRINISTDSRNEADEVWADAKLHLSTLATFWMLVLGLIYVMLDRAMRQLPTLLDAFGRIGGGRLGEHIPIEGPAEFAKLSRGFNDMSLLLAEMDGRNKRLHNQLDKVQEEERAALARDLHDDVGPLLFSIDVDATAIRQTAGSAKPEDIAARAAGIQNAVAQVKEQVRAILWQLRPGVLLDLGLANAVENLAAFWAARHPHVVFALDIPQTTWGAQTEMALYSIVREGLNNALHHGKPNRIGITIRPLSDSKVEARILDDGGGLRVASGGGLGLVSMRERAALAGGRIEIANTADGSGVEVIAVLPVSTPAPTQVANAEDPAPKLAT